MELVLIRHGMTKGNREQRYVGGRTDEPLLPSALEELRKRRVAPVDVLYCSPMIRCKQTAGALFPGQPARILEDLRECDFGRFENRNYSEMADDEEYKAFVESNASLPFPGGESGEAFRMRCLSALDQILEELAEKKTVRAAVVAHGGTIMSMLEACGSPERSFYEWHLENGEAYVCRVHPSVRPPLLKVIDHADVTDELTIRKDHGRVI